MYSQILNNAYIIKMQKIKRKKDILKAARESIERPKIDASSM